MHEIVVKSHFNRHYIDYTTEADTYFFETRTKKNVEV
jgi:hypothetical protein